jgi:hypothetical protein
MAFVGISGRAPPVLEKRPGFGAHGVAVGVPDTKVYRPDMF